MMITKHGKSLLFASVFCSALIFTNVAAMQEASTTPATGTQTNIHVVDSKEARQDNEAQTPDALGKKLIESIVDAYDKITTADNQIQKQFRAFELEGTMLTLLNQKTNLQVYQTHNLDGETVSVSAIHLLTFYSCYLDKLKPCLSLLIRGGAKVNAKTSKGKTALHYAAQKGCLDIVKMLVNAGASLDIYDLNHHTAYHEALIAKHLEIVEYLIAMGSAPGLPYSKEPNEIPSTNNLYEFLRPDDDYDLDDHRRFDDYRHADARDRLQNLLDKWAQKEAKKMKLAIINGLKKKAANSIDRHNWMRIAPLLAFYRANANHPFQDSILTLIPHAITPFIIGEKKRNEKKLAKLWETRGVVTATPYPSLAKMFEEEKAERLAQTRGVTTATYIPLEKMFTEKAVENSTLTQTTGKSENQQS